MSPLEIAVGRKISTEVENIEDLKKSDPEAYSILVVINEMARRISEEGKARRGK
jgi:hypothetical protein